MDFLPSEISEYAEKYTQAEPRLLAKLNRDTHCNVLIPRMLSGHLQGRFLSFISKIKKPKYILEIGTYTGYSALCMTEGLAPDGALHTIDKNEELEERILKYFNESDKGSQMHLHVGNALEIIPTLSQPFELVFIDADKENYATYYDLIIDQLPAGAIIIADNVLWSGKVLDPKELKDDLETKQLHAFNQKIHEDPRVENVLLPLRDGLMLVMKV
jgi:predicted O-methyltransferase YrrM